MPKRLFYILLVCMLSKPAISQTISNNEIQKSDSLPINLYYQSLGNQSPLYNGSEYLEYSYTIQEGHPFFESPAFVKGDIRFDGMEFHDVPILYDIIKDQVIILHFGNIFKVNLPAEKVEQFTLAGHTFIRLIQDTSQQLKTGFYDRLYNGKTIVLAKREKKIREEHVNFVISNIVDQKNHYYIKKDNSYYVFKNFRTLISILKNKKKEIQQYMSKNKIKFKINPELAMIMAAEYYDKLTN